jgi:hypothetical protein
MKKTDIVDRIIALMDDYDIFGLRADRAGIEAGHIFAPSHQLFQDYPGYWEKGKDIFNDPDFPYDEDLGLWDAGELDGVCCVRIGHPYDAKSEAVMRAHLMTVVDNAIKRVDIYTSDYYRSVYLVAGNTRHEGGNDIDEVIINDGICLGDIDDL